MGKNHFAETIRNVELLARLLNNEQITKSQAAEQYNVEEVTITRALQYYRSLGIEAFGRKSGIRTFNKPKKDDLIVLLAEYLSIKLNSDYFINSIKTFSKIDPDFFSKIILIAKAVKEETIIKIEYQRLSDNLVSNYTIKPYKLIDSNNNWIMHAVKVDETILKTFYLSRIKKILFIGRKFKKEVLEERTGDIKEIILKFAPQVEQELYYKIWFEDFEIEKLENGYLLLKTKQPITNKLASWCISWWDTIQIVEPLKLKEYINEMIDNYKAKNQ